MLLSESVAGWSLSPIQNTVGKGAEGGGYASPFFSTPQRTSIKSETVAAMGGSGQTYRPVAPENQSMLETALYAANEWLKSPYEQQFSIPAKVTESKNLSSSISTAKPGLVGGTIDTLISALNWGTEKTAKITTAADEFMQAWGISPRKTESQGPAEIGNSPGYLQYLESLKTTGASVWETLSTAGQGWIDQVKGLFNLGYGQTGTQSAFAIPLEIKSGTSVFVLVAIVGVIAFILLKSKK